MEPAAQLHFGALLRQFRLDAGMTQQTLAERANLSVEAVSTLERGTRTRPYRETVVLLARALELSPEREALLESAIEIAHQPRRRERIASVKPSLLRIVRSDTKVTQRHNLPQQLTSFVGRQHELGEMIALLREHRLVTVVGAGGVGKTRIAVQIGSEVLDAFPDGVWLVELASLADQSLVANAVLSALRIPSTTGPALDVVVAYLKTRGLLLILDNCEHVVAAAREIASGILELCPQVRILATSREALEIGGERAYRLPSLAVPPDSCRSSRDALRYGAVPLFVERALAVDAGFSLSDGNAADVAEICRRLDGIPLAIELAAARVKVLAPRQIAERLDQRFRLLAGGDSGALPRHQTMTALIDWSYDLLTRREQRFFESLSVFAGGCTLDAATAVCAIAGEDELDVIDLITSLVTKSLLVAELAGYEQRYRLLETSRQYARGKLMARDEQEQVARRHALVYLELAERLERRWNMAPDASPPREYLELENWRGALEWALGRRGDVILGECLASRKVVWHSFTPAETRHWVRAALELVVEATPPAVTARLEHADAQSADLLLEPAVSLAAAERALARYRELGDEMGVAQTLGLAGGSLAMLGRPAEAEALLREALELARALGGRRLAGVILHRLGWARQAVNDFAGARAHFREVLELAKTLGDQNLWASVTSDLASNEAVAGDPESALCIYLDLLMADSVQNTSSPSTRTEFSITETTIAGALVNMAECLVALGRYNQARVQANKALEFARGFKLDVVVAASLEHLAIVAIRRAQVEGQHSPAEYAGATRLLGFVRTRLHELRNDAIGSRYDNDLALLTNVIGADKLAHLMALGAAMTEDEAIVQAQALG
jgi:predicted ATPase/DNA-binding XRE family transcriptional regulator